MPRVLLIDNYDSFVYNLVQYLGELGADPVVHRCDAIGVEERPNMPGTVDEWPNWSLALPVFSYAPGRWGE